MRITILIFKTLALGIFLTQFSFGQGKAYPPSMVCKVITLVPNSTAHATHNRLAIADSIKKCGKMIVYIDSGTFYIDSTIDWKDDAGAPRAFRVLAGRSKTSTKLILKQAVAGSDSVVMLRTYDQIGGEGSAFSNGIWDLTVDVGIANPKAIGILWSSNNWGNIQDVRIQSSDIGRVGNCGIKMDLPNIGPTLIKNVRIVGFDVGIRTSQNQTGVVLEHIELDSQIVTGIKNCRNSLTIRDLKSNNTVPVIQNFLCSEIGATYGGMITLLGGNFQSGGSNASAIENDFVGTLSEGISPEMRYGSLFLRGIVSSGYKSIIRNVPGKQFKQFVYGKNFSSGLKLTNLPPPHYPDTLPVLETPEFHDSNLSNWVHVCGASTAGPSSPWTPSDSCFAKAIDSITHERSTLYFPPGSYFYTSTKIIPKKVKRIVGYGANIYPKTNFSTKQDGQGNGYQGTEHYANRTPPESTDFIPLIKIEGDTSETLHIEGVNFGERRDPYTGDPYLDRLLIFDHTSNRAVKISFSRLAEKMNEARIYRSSTSAGNLFIENVASTSISRWEFNQQQSVWARQLNPEGWTPLGYPKILNKGAKLWVLGLKTENINTVLRDTANGQAEIYGGYIIPVGDSAMSPNVPVFENFNSKLTLVYTHNKYRHGYPTQIRDVQGSIERQVSTQEAHYAEDLSRVMFYYGGPKAGFDKGDSTIAAINHLLQ